MSKCPQQDSPEIEKSVTPTDTLSFSKGFATERHKKINDRDGRMWLKITLCLQWGTNSATSREVIAGNALIGRDPIPSIPFGIVIRSVGGIEETVRRLG